MMEIKRKHAICPFTFEARELVNDIDSSFVEIVRGEPEIVERAVGRLEKAITGEDPEKFFPSPTVPIDEAHRNELLSYPVARALVSIIGHKGAIEQFSEYEAKRVLVNTDKHRSDGGVSYEYLLDEFNFGNIIESENDIYTKEIAVEAFVQYSPEKDSSRWSLTSRAVDQGYVAVAPNEIDALLQWAIAERIRSDLPFDVPTSTKEALQEEVNRLQAIIGDVSIPRQRQMPESPEVDNFPECMLTLYQKLESGENISKIELFVLASFTAYIGLDSDELLSIETIDKTGPRGEIITSAYNGEFLPPRCDTLIAKGICSKADCHKGSHPLVEYLSNSRES